jgi:hypothetical protein
MLATHLMERGMYNARTMPTLLQIVLAYLRVAAAYWWVLLPGGVMAAPDTIKWHHPTKEIKFPFWLRLSIAIACVFVAQFLAYRNQTINLARVIEEKQQFSIAMNKQADQIQEQATQIQGLKQQITSIKSRLPRAGIIPLNKTDLDTFKGALMDLRPGKVTLAFINGRSSEEGLCHQLGRAFTDSLKWDDLSPGCVAYGQETEWSTITKYSPANRIIIRSTLLDAQAQWVQLALKEIGFNVEADVDKNNKAFNGKPLDGIEVIIGYLK